MDRNEDAIELDEEAVDAAGAALADRIGDEPWSKLDEDSREAIREEVRVTVRVYLAKAREGSRVEPPHPVVSAIRRTGF